MSRFGSKETDDATVRKKSVDVGANRHTLGSRGWRYEAGDQVGMNHTNKPFSNLNILCVPVELSHPCENNRNRVETRIQ